MDSDQIKRAKLAAMTAMGQAKPSRSLAAAMRRMDKALEKKDPRRMTPPDPQQVAEIAGRLSKAQREAVLKCREEWLNAAEIGASGAVLTALCWRWLDGYDAPPVSLLKRDYQDRPLRYIYHLTPLGLAVRNFIQGTHHD